MAFSLEGRLAMLTNPYLTSKVITVDGGIYPA